MNQLIIAFVAAATQIKSQRDLRDRSHTSRLSGAAHSRQARPASCSQLWKGVDDGLERLCGVAQRLALEGHAEGGAAAAVGAPVDVERVKLLAVAAFARVKEVGGWAGRRTARTREHRLGPVYTAGR